MKIHYCHGLESGPDGFKARSLREHFEVNAPDQHMSVRSLWKKNSVLRCWIRGLPSLSFGGAVLGSLDACVEVQRRALQRSTPDVLIGSSWGGWVAAVLLAEGHYSGPAILLCPALRTMQQRAPWSSTLTDHPRHADRLTERLAALPFTKTLRLVHGTSDTVVDLQDSVRLSEATGIRLDRIEGGTHGLSSLIHEGRLVATIRSLG